MTLLAAALHLVPGFLCCELLAGWRIHLDRFVRPSSVLATCLPAFFVSCLLPLSVLLCLSMFSCCLSPIFSFSILKQELKVRDQDFGA